MPKSPVANGSSGNKNMKGKKGVHVFRCNCCFQLGYLKDNELNKLVRKEMQEEINNYYDK